MSSVSSGAGGNLRRIATARGGGSGYLHRGPRIPHLIRHPHPRPPAGPHAAACRGRCWAFLPNPPSCRPWCPTRRRSRDSLELAYPLALPTEPLGGTTVSAGAAALCLKPRSHRESAGKRSKVAWVKTPHAELHPFECALAAAAPRLHQHWCGETYKLFCRLLRQRALRCRRGEIPLGTWP